MNRRDFIFSSTAAVLMLGTDGMTKPEPPLRVQRLSWAGIKLEFGDFTVFIDPFTSKDIWDGAWQMPVIPLEVTTKSRTVVITHLHNDHFDQPALKELLPQSGSVHCHAPIATAVASRGFRVRAAQRYEPLFIGDITIAAVPAVDGLNEDQVSWIASAGGKRIFHGGDTLWHGSWYHIARQFGPFDAAFLPINGVRLRGRQSVDSEVPASMTPEQAVAAALVLGAKKLVPIHYGVSDAGYVEYPDAIPTCQRESAHRKVNLQVVEPGAWVEV